MNTLGVLKATHTTQSSLRRLSLLAFSRHSFSIIPRTLMQRRYHSVTGGNILGGVSSKALSGSALSRPVWPFTNSAASFALLLHVLDIGGRRCVLHADHLSTQESRLLRRPFAVSVTLNPLNNQSLLCLPQSLKVPLLLRLVGGFGCVAVGDVGEEGFLSIWAGFGSVIFVHLVFRADWFGESGRE